MLEFCTHCLREGVAKLVEPAYAGCGKSLCEDHQCMVWHELKIPGATPSYTRLQEPRTSGAATPAMSDAEIGEALNMSASAVHSARKAMLSRFESLLKESE